jgi:hypothetical protein
MVCRGGFAAFIRLEDDVAFGDRPIMAAAALFRSIRRRAGSGAADVALAEAAVALDYGYCADHNAPDGTGRLLTQSTAETAFAFPPMTLISKLHGPWESYRRW